MNKLAFTLSLLLFLASLLTLNVNAASDPIEDPLLRKVEAGHECYDPVHHQRYCSIFPFKSSLGPGMEEGNIDEAYKYFKLFVPNHNETHRHILRAFSCYVSLGICNAHVWGIPRGNDYGQFKYMLKNEQFADLGNNHSLEPVLCKRTCQQALDIFTLQPALKVHLGDDKYQICSKLPNKDCIDAEEMGKYHISGSIARSLVQSFVAFVAFFTATLFIFGL